MILCARGILQVFSNVQSGPRLDPFVESQYHKDEMRFSFTKFILSFTLLVGVAGALFWNVNGKATDRAENGPRYKEFMVRRGDFQVSVTASGLVKPINRIEIKSKASGQIESLPVNEGDHVQKRDLIARLDQKDEASAVALAEADLLIAEAERKQADQMFKRRNALYQKKIISEEERDQIALKLAVAKGKVIQAATALERARERLSDAVVRAPIDGIILQKYVEEGQIISSGVSNVSGGTPIVDIAAMQSVYIEAGIDEIDIGKIQIGQSASIVAESYPQLTFQGKVIRIAPEAKVEQNVTLFDVIVEVKNRENRLKSGMNTQIAFTILSKKNILLAPVIALKSIDDSKSDGKERNVRSVQLKEGENYLAHTITIGLSDFSDAEVLSGLKEGDILGVPMTSRLKTDNERLEKRIKKSRSFGGGSKKKPK